MHPDADGCQKDGVQQLLGSLIAGLVFGAGMLALFWRGERFVPAGLRRWLSDALSRRLGSAFLKSAVPIRGRRNRRTGPVAITCAFDDRLQADGYDHPVPMAGLKRAVFQVCFAAERIGTVNSLRSPRGPNMTLNTALTLLPASATEWHSPDSGAP